MSNIKYCVGLAICGYALAAAVAGGILGVLLGSMSAVLAIIYPFIRGESLQQATIAQ